jgi:hypothetical protein
MMIITPQVFAQNEQIKVMKSAEDLVSKTLDGHATLQSVGLLRDYTTAEPHDIRVYCRPVGGLPMTRHGVSGVSRLTLRDGLRSKGTHFGIHNMSPFLPSLLDT